MEIDKIKQAFAKTLVKKFAGKLAKGIDEKIDDIKFDIDFFSSSHFDAKTKTVFLNAENCDNVNTLIHELLHAVSTNTFEDKIYIGFNKKSYKSLSNNKLLENSYGYALNEGATHYYTRQLTNENFGKIVAISSYDFCANIFYNLENLIGSDVLKTIYLNSSAKEIIPVVANCCHTSEENVLKLILNMDSFMDTFRFYNGFLQQQENADIKSLLSNCYFYLNKIIEDKAKFGNVSAMYSTAELSKEELKFLFKCIEFTKNIENFSVENVPIKEYEKMSKFIFYECLNNRFDNFDIIRKELKSGEFYNFLLLNNHICDQNGQINNIESSMVTSKITKMLFDKNTNSFLEDKNLPYDIRTLLSTRFVVRADCNVDDYYMKKCIKKEQFSKYLIESDSEYYNSIKNKDCI